jgi:hypothetical protein
MGQETSSILVFAIFTIVCGRSLSPGFGFALAGLVVAERIQWE